MWWRSLVHSAHACAMVHRMASADRRTGYEAGRDNVKYLGIEVHKPVFFVSSLTIIAFVVGVLAFRDAAGGVFDSLYAWLVSTFDWVFMGTVNIFLLFCILLLVTPAGRVRLGGPDARPDYSLWSWFAMLFAAGIGIGLMFFGVAEPVQHFLNPPLGVDAADTAAARSVAMAATIFHWGIHPWALYAVIALALAFSAYNLRLPLTIRAGFHPLLGDAVWGRLGHCIDIMAVFATLFGLATSLGLGTEQLAAGLALLFGVPDTAATRVLVIAAVTTIATGVGGVRNGQGHQAPEPGQPVPCATVARVRPGGGPDPRPVLRVRRRHRSLSRPNRPAQATGSGRDDLDFMHGWTTFYWAWWLSWAPFVGPLHRAGVARPHGAPTRRLHAGRPGAPLLRALVQRLRGDRAVPAHRRRPHGGGPGGWGRPARIGPLRAARCAPAREHNAGDRHRARGRLLHHLLRFRLAGDRHHQPLAAGSTPRPGCASSGAPSRGSSPSRS